MKLARAGGAGSKSVLRKTVCRSSTNVSVRKGTASASLAARKPRVLDAPRGDCAFTSACGNGLQRLVRSTRMESGSPRGQKKQVTCAASDYMSNYADNEDSELRRAGPTLRNLCFLNFWLQLPLTLVSIIILFFSATLTKTPSDPTKLFTFVGVIFAMLSTFFAHGFLTLANRVLQNERVRKEWIMGNLLRNNTLNLFGIGVTIVGLQAAVGTLVAKTFLQTANQPYTMPQPGSNLVSLDVYSLQASTNTLLAHFLSLVFTNLILRVLNKGRTN